MLAEFPLPPAVMSIGSSGVNARFRNVSTSILLSGVSMTPIVCKGLGRPGVKLKLPMNRDFLASSVMRLSMSFKSAWTVDGGHPRELECEPERAAGSGGGAGSAVFQPQRRQHRLGQSERTSVNNLTLHRVQRDGSPLVRQSSAGTT